jgi:hypothetical protein
MKLIEFASGIDSYEQKKIYSEYSEPENVFRHDFAYLIGLHGSYIPII